MNILITGSNGFVRVPLFLAIAIGKLFDVIASITKRDIPINSDRMKKFATSTEYYSEKIREAGYVQQHTIEDEIKQTCEWYLKVNTT
ncbi:MAG: hypothetical protein ISS38_01065 [Candidatus Cloacimonetes bacterium]|nr:hypothetical protein [Candidatus Cloacimonadota bacterium]